MKRNHLIVLIMIGASTPLFTAEKPSYWQKFKNSLSFKKKDEKKEDNKENMGENETEQTQGFITKVARLYRGTVEFKSFIIEHIRMLQVKIKTVEVVEEELKKISQEEQSKSPLHKQLGRLRADLFMSLVEVLEKSRQVAVTLKEFVSAEGIIKILDTLIKEGNKIGERLLKASDAYGKTTLFTKEISPVEINKYIESALQIITRFQSTIAQLDSLMVGTKKVIKVANVLSLGAVTMFAIFANILSKGIRAAKLVADMSKDIFVNAIDHNRIQQVDQELNTIARDIDNTDKDLTLIKKEVENGVTFIEPEIIRIKNSYL